jgi:signal transduction histidine kinase
VNEIGHSYEPCKRKELFMGTTELTGDGSKPESKLSEEEAAKLLREKSAEFKEILKRFKSHSTEQEEVIESIESVIKTIDTKYPPEKGK